MKKILFLLICVVMLISCQKTSLVSLLDNQDAEKTIDTLLLSNNSQIEFSFGQVPYEDIRNDILISDIKKLSIDQEKKVEEIEFIIHFDTSLFNEQNTVKISIDRNNKQQILSFIKQDNLTNSKLDAIDTIIKKELLNTMNTMGLKEFNFTANELEKVFSVDEISIADTFEEMRILSKDQIEVCLPIHASTELVDAKSSLLVNLTKESNTWTITDIQLESDQTQMILSEQVIGRWVGQFVIKDRRFIAVLAVNGLSEDLNSYEGIMIHGVCQYINMDARTSLNDKYRTCVYTYELVPNLSNNTLDLIGGEYTIDKSHGSGTYYDEPLEYSFKFNGSEYLIGTPTNWTNVLGPHVSFDQKHDSYDYD